MYGKHVAKDSHQVCLLPLICSAVSFPFTEPLVQLVVDHLEAGKAMDFLAKSASKIIAERKMDSEHSTVVSGWVYAFVGYN